METIDNGKPIRETLNADIPLVADHYRRALLRRDHCRLHLSLSSLPHHSYFAGCLRAQEGATTQLDEHTVAHHVYEPVRPGSNYSPCR